MDYAAAAAAAAKPDDGAGKNLSTFTLTDQYLGLLVAVLWHCGLCEVSVLDWGF